MRRILVVAAHPDDEVIGCGGTIFRHTSAGDRVHVVILTEGATAQYPDDPSMVARKQQEARAAAGVLGVSAVRFVGLPDMRLDTLPGMEIARPIEEEVRQLGPEIVYTHHAGDINEDHRRVALATLVATRPLPGSTVRAVYACEVPSASEWGGAPFHPNSYRRIDGEPLERKVEALRAYGSEVRESPHPRSLEAVRSRAAARGAEAGLRAAEAFILLREVDRR